MNNRNRIPEIRKRIENNEYEVLPAQREWEELCEIVRENPLDSVIEYGGYCIYTEGNIAPVISFSGLEPNALTEDKGDREILQEIEAAVMQGELVLTYEQELILQKAKQRIKQQTELGKLDFQLVANESDAIQHKNGVASQIKDTLTQEYENEDTVLGQGE